MIRNINKKSLLILLISYLSLGLTIKEDKWNLVKNSNGIKAYTRTVEGSDVKQVKVKTNINATLSAILNLIRDVDAQTEWVYRCIKAKKLRTISETEHYLYIESEAPWPISNRDVITHSQIIQNKKSKKISIISIGKPNFIKEIKGKVRVKKLESRWELIPKENGTVDVYFFMLIDIGGNLPAWVINLAIEDGPFETISNLKRIVKTQKYKNVKLNFIEEL